MGEVALGSALRNLVYGFSFATDLWPSLVSQWWHLSQFPRSKMRGVVVSTTLPLRFVVRISEVTLRCSDNKNVHI